MSELYHYGVLGMKWGVRHDKDYKYTSRRTKNYDEKIRRLKLNGKIDKASKIERRRARSSELDRRDQEYANRVSSVGNVLTRSLVPGGFGTRTYQRVLSALGGQSQKGITAKKLGAAALTTLGGAIVGSIGASVLGVPAAVTLGLQGYHPAVMLGEAIVTTMASRQIGRLAVSKLASSAFERDGEDKKK